jgi:PhoPQ-activated pathogenicity-related protein
VNRITLFSARRQLGFWLLAPTIVGVLVVVSAGCQPKPAPSSAGPEPSSARLRHVRNLTALDRYVAAPDTNFHWRLVNTVRGQGATAYLLEFTSQAWLTPNEVDQPLWRHSLLITRPDQVTNNKALLFIGGGRNDKPPPKGPDENVIRTAIRSKSIVAELRHVPNQPLVFLKDGQPRVEDDLIAYTWDKFLRTGDERWPARLPMTKSAVRAMDAVTAFCASPEGGRIVVDGFVVAGGSKRGWTTWTTAAVDPRVVAIVPIVIDVLNIEPSMRHHYAAYGFWAPAVGDYTNHHIMEWMGTRQFKALARIEEPYEYRHRYRLPKLILNATGDQFFLPDSSQFYFENLPGDNYLRYVPNADHSLKDTDAWETLDAFYRSILNRIPLPQLKWTFDKDGSIRARTADAPREVKLWQATNPHARDFRIESLGPKWEGTPLAGRAGVYHAKVPAPAQGWTAFLVEFTFARPDGPPLKLTTGVRVVPDKTGYRYMPDLKP